jgi:cold shock CspA family protein/ribosome-associated translation inhibitor RaiA
METPLELSFRGLENTEDREDLVREKVAKLEQVCDTITSCRVAVETAQESQQTGNALRMRVEVRVPRHNEIVVTQKLDSDQAADPFPRLVRDTFEAVQRKLREVTERQRGEVKPGATVDELAIVSKLFEGRDYGFLETMDRREIFFHRNAVLNNDFDRLTVGTGVRFVEEEGEKGPQASTVLIVDKPGVSSPHAEAEG